MAAPTLHNGAKVIDHKPVPGKGDEYIVLAWTGSDYVTWHAHVQDGQLETYWGHYFATDVAAAERDFAKRTTT